MKRFVALILLLRKSESQQQWGQIPDGSVFVGTDPCDHFSIARDLRRSKAARAFWQTRSCFGAAKCPLLHLGEIV
jgi:hypothetical protein